MDIGAQLRTSREVRGLSLDALAVRTRVQPRILAAIERNDVSSIPPKPYGRGFVRAYAREVGRDADDTVRQYFAQFAPQGGDAVPVPPEVGRQPSPALLWVGGTALSVLVLVLWSVGSTSTPPRDADPVVGTSGAAASVPTSLADSPVRAKLTAAGPTSASQTVTVVLTATRDCWVTATADGERVVFRLLNAGSRETLRGDREVVIRAGDAGALSLTINGRDAGPFGAPGQVRTLRITPADAASTR